MLAISYLFISMLVGLALVTALIPRAAQKKIYTVCGEKGRNPLFLLFPAVCLSGLLVMMWATYLVACLCSDCENPLTVSNAICMPFFQIASVLVLVLLRKRFAWKKLLKSLKPKPSEMLFIGASFAFAIVMCIATFRVVKGELIVGYPLVEDFSLHVNMIRSFSLWQRIPAQYPCFADSSMNYHFMMNFLAGNLEFLGMRLDFAFNVPTVLVILSMYFAVYECCFRLTGSKWVCHIAWLLVTFRPGLGLFQKLAEVDSVSDFMKNNTTYVGNTEKEWWGLYDGNAFMNQRHLIFGFAVMLMTVSLFLPYLIKGLEERKAIRKQTKFGLRRIGRILKEEAFSPRKSAILTAVFAGFCVGMTGYVNGPSVIITLVVLFVMALFSKEQLSYLLTAVLSVGLTLLQLNAFSEQNGAVSLKLHFGYLFTKPSWKEIVIFITFLLGVSVPILLGGLLIGQNAHRVMTVAALMPGALAFCLQLSPKIVQNHKFILASQLLLGIMTAVGIHTIWTLVAPKYAVVRRSVRTILILCLIPLTLTGVYNDYLLIRKSNYQNCYPVTMDTELLRWAKENGVTRDTLFFGYQQFFSEQMLCGFQNYLGLGSMCDSAGYDTAERTKLFNDIANNNLTDDELKSEFQKRGISYFIINEQNNRLFTDEGKQKLESLFPVAFSGTRQQIIVYDVR